MVFKCLNNCGECCGVVPIPTGVWNKSQDKIIGKVVDIFATEVYIFPITDNSECCFLTQEKQCGIYKDRPDVCKKYGLDENKLPCPYLRRSGNPRSPANKKQIMKKINKDVDLAMKIAKSKNKELGEVKNAKSKE